MFCSTINWITINISVLENIVHAPYIMQSWMMSSSSSLLLSSQNRPFSLWGLNSQYLAYRIFCKSWTSEMIWGEGSVLKTFVWHCLAGHSQKLQKRTSPVTCDNKEWFIWMAFPIFSTEKIKLQAAIQDFFGWLEEVFFLVLKIVIPSLMNHSKGKKL